MFGQVFFQRDFNLRGWKSPSRYGHVRQCGAQCRRNPEGNRNLWNAASQWTANLGVLRLFWFGCHSGLVYKHRSPLFAIPLIG